MFLRFYGCNLRCVWCDTPYTWANTPAKASVHISKKVYPLAENQKMMTIWQVLQNLQSLWPTPGNVVISGGEPFMQARLSTLLAELIERGYTSAVETAGTIMPTDTQLALLDTIVVSPKLENSGNKLHARYKHQVLSKFAERDKSWFKFVVRQTSDLEEIDQIVFEAGINKHRVMLMAEGTEPEAVVEGSRALVNHALERGYGLSPRWHTILWKDERGK